MAWINPTLSERDLTAKINKAVFFDRDGTLIEDTDFLIDKQFLQILPGAAQALQKLKGAGYLIVVLTNQSAIARGFLNEADLAKIHLELVRRLQKQNAQIDAIYYCPHHPTIGPVQYRQDCDCRKPESGMFYRAARELNIDLKQSFAIGDSLRDALAAEHAGAKPILVRTGPGAVEAQQSPGLFFGMADNLHAAAQLILNTLE